MSLALDAHARIGQRAQRKRLPCLTRLSVDTTYRNAQKAAQSTSRCEDRVALGTAGRFFAGRCNPSLIVSNYDTGAVVPARMTN